MTSEINAHHWTERLGNKFNVKPTHDEIQQIIEHGSFTRWCNCSLKGQSKRKSARVELKLIEYDRSYLLGYLRVNLRDFLKLPYNECQKLISEARKL